MINNVKYWLLAICVVLGPVIIAFPAIFILSACSTHETLHDNGCPKYIEVDSADEVNLGLDPIEIVGAKVEGDCLKVTLRYGGGCSKHQVDLTLSRLNAEAGLPQPPPILELRHNAGGDKCKALIISEYSFNISGIRERGKNKTTFILRVRDAMGVSGTGTYEYTY